MDLVPFWQSPPLRVVAHSFHSCIVVLWTINLLSLSLLCMYYEYFDFSKFADSVLLTEPVYSTRISSNIESDKIRVTRAQSCGTGHKNDAVLKVKQC